MKYRNERFPIKGRFTYRLKYFKAHSTAERVDDKIAKSCGVMKSTESGT